MSGTRTDCIGGGVCVGVVASLTGRSGAQALQRTAMSAQAKAKLLGVQSTRAMAEFKEAAEGAATPCAPGTTAKGVIAMRLYSEFQAALAEARAACDTAIAATEAADDDSEAEADDTEAGSDETHDHFLARHHAERAPRVSSLAKLTSSLDPAADTT
jgi:hypothetical protein